MTTPTNSRTLIVPIHIEALRVSPSNTQNSKKSVYDFSVLGQHPTSALGNLVAADRFEDAIMRLEPGAHLHWSLPRAYTHGVQNHSTGAIEFPKMPNRWLIVRFLKDNTKQTSNTATRLWILESDAHDSDSSEIGANSTLIPWMDNASDIQGIEPNHAGRRIDLKQNWSEPELSNSAGNYLGNLFQAPFGYGETFTGYYQNCGTILGLYDDFSDYFPNFNQLESNSDFTATYAVIGWVNTIAADECNIILNQALADYRQMTADQPDFASYIGSVIEDKLNWSLDDYSVLTTDNIGKMHAVMSGILTDLVWKIGLNTNNTYPSPMPSADNVQVAVGNNTAEALSAYLAAVETSLLSADAGNGVDSNIEWLLNALQFNQLHKLAAGDIGIGQLKEYLHDTCFASAPGGYLWSIRTKAKPGEQKAGAGDDEVTLPLYLARILSELNRMQQSLNQTQNEIKSRQKQLFFDWTYHITNIDTQVINGSAPLSADNSGDFLVDGLLQLYPALLRAGVFSDSTSPSAPYDPKPETFNILAPSGSIQNLPDYAFNSSSNETAAQFIQTMLKFGLDIDRIGDAHLPDAGQKLSEALEFLTLYQAGGVQADVYLAKAAEQLASALGELQTAAQKIIGLSDPNSGLAAAKSSVDAAQKTLAGYIDGTNGVFATALQYKPDPGKAPLAAGQTYQGAILPPTLNALKSWDAAVGAFPGIKKQMDIFSGQNNQPSNLLDIQAAALYLGLAYFYFKSNIPFKCSSAYYLQMSEQTIGNALNDAQTVSNTLQKSLSVLSDNALSKMSAAIANLAANVVPAIQNEVNNAGNIGDAVAQIKTVITSLTDLRSTIFSADWATLRTGIDAAALTIAARLPAAQQVAQWNQFLYAQISGEYEMNAVPDNHFYFPNEPVILLSEEDGKGTILKDFARNGKAVRTPCRLESDIVSAQTATVAFPPEIADLTNRMQTGIDGLSTLIESLVQETYLLSSQFAPVVSSDNLKAAAIANEDLHYNQLSDVLLNAPPTGLTGKLPYYIAYNWRADDDPFLPLFIWWQAGYQYSQQFEFANESYPINYLDQFKLDSYEIDLQPTAESISQFNPNGENSNLFNTHGLISLSDATTSNLCGQIRIYCQTYLNYDPAGGAPPQTLPDFDEANKFFEAYQDFNTRNILSQGLSGFNPSLIQRAQHIQLPITIPRWWTNSSGKNLPLSQFWATSFLNNQSGSWSMTWEDEAIDSNAFAAGSAKMYFNPLRAGFMNVKRIVLVDAFGRFAELKNPDPATIAETMQSAQGAPSGRNIYLAPRLVQPSRLSFDWISTASSEGIGSFVDLNNHPASSPICGWIYPNHLDDSLMLYDSTGIPLGSLRLRGTVLHWFPVPGETTQPGAENRDQMIQYLTSKKANPVFTDFLLKYLYPDTSAAASKKFQSVLNVFGKSQQFVITPAMQEDQALAVLMGRPLVVAQSSLSLELNGLPPTALDSTTYPAWNKFGPQFNINANQYIPYNFDNFNKANIENLQIPVRIGTAEIRKNDGSKIPYFDDGLVGYFMPDEWDTLYTPVELPDEPGIISLSDPVSYPLKLTPNGEAATLTMLLDPRATVHATTGLLPVGSITIPSDQYAEIVDRLEVTFLAAPILAAGEIPGVPLPDEKGFDWSWVEVGSSEIELRPAQGISDAVFPPSPQHLIDGWLKLKKGK